MTHFENFRQWLNQFHDSDNIDPHWPIQPNLAHATLSSVIKELKSRQLLADALLILDLDKTCRAQPWSNVYRLRFGEMTTDELILLEHIRDYAHQLLVVTNQTTVGHYVARICSQIGAYEAYPRALEDRGIQVLGARPGSLPGFSPPYKTTQQALEDTVAALSHTETPRSIVVVGDKVSDISFANALFLYLTQREIIDETHRFIAYLLTTAVPEQDAERVHTSLRLARI